jgi:type II secretory pathway predicted ATPase ExeA
LTVLIGEAGTGKTTLLRAALESEACRHVRTVYISNPALKRDEFVQLLARNFELSAEAARSKAVMLGELEAALKDARARGETISLVVDEAQALSDELLEEIRLLANVETSSEKLLPLVLAGQPELAARLNESQLRQLKQRVSLRCEIRPLDLSEAAAYVAARIRAAGGEPFRLFSREAITLIHQRSRGIPRTMSVICDNSLISGFAQGAQPVTREMVLEVCRDFDISGGNFGRESASAQSTDILAMAPDEDQTSDESAERSGLPGPSTTMQRRANSTAKANQGRRRFSLFGR